jgi:hypothetical protein
VSRPMPDLKIAIILGSTLKSVRELETFNA